MAAYEDYRRFGSATRTDVIFEDADGTLTPFFDHPDDNPLIIDIELRSWLRGKASERSAPCLECDDYGMYYAAMQSGTGWMYIGPMQSEDTSEYRLRQYYKRHGINKSEIRRLRTFTMPTITDITLLAALMILGVSYPEADLMDPGSQDQDRAGQRRDEVAFVLNEEAANDDDGWRHTYGDETMLMQAVREGRTEDAVRLAQKMDDDAGRLASTGIGHWRTLTIIGITLCSRAAIEGGISPETAYRISGYYIQKVEHLSDAKSLYRLRNKAIEELTTHVSSARHSLGMSNYTAKCKDYVRKNYREKIYIDDIADSLGITTAHLSRLFKQDTGVTFQEFVNQVRIARAAELLQYTDMSLSDIAVYVHFPSQSYFGRIFKRYRNITPKGYRDRFKAGEFHK